MTSWSSVIPLSEITREFLSAEYYAPEYLQLEAKLLSTAEVSDLSGLCKGNLFQGWSPIGGVKGGDGIPAIKVKNLTGKGITWEMDRVDIQPSGVPKRAWAVEGDLYVIRCAHHNRYIGLSIDNYFEIDRINKPFLTEKIIVARGVSKKANTGYVTAFLRTGMGYLQIQRRLGGLTANYTPYDFGKVKIPIPDRRIQDYIGTKVELAERCRAKAFNHLDHAKDLLKKVLGLDPFKIPGLQNLTNDNFKVFSLLPACSLVYPSRLIGMIAAHCYEPIHLAVERALTQAGIKQKSFADIMIEVANGFDCRDFAESGTRYIKVANLHHGRVIHGSCQYVRINVDDVPSRQRVHNGDLLITRKGSFGICAGAVREDERAIISSEIIRVRLKKDFDADFIAFFLNSVFGRSKFDRLATGTMMQGISHGNLDEIRLPCINNEDQKKVADVVRKWRAALEAADRLVDEAKTDVEALIEGTLDTDAILAGRLKPPTMEEIIGT